MHYSYLRILLSNVLFLLHLAVFQHGWSGRPQLHKRYSSWDMERETEWNQELMNLDGGFYMAPCSNADAWQPCLQPMTTMCQWLYRYSSLMLTIVLVINCSLCVKIILPLYPSHCLYSWPCLSLPCLHLIPPVVCLLIWKYLLKRHERSIYIGWKINNSAIVFLTTEWIWTTWAF